VKAPGYLIRWRLQHIAEKGKYMFTSFKKSKPKAERPYNHRLALALIFSCFTYYVCVRGFVGNYYIPKGTLNVYFQIGGNTLSTIILYIGFVISVMLGISEYKKEYHQKFILLPVVMFIPIFIWSITDLFNGHTLRSLLGITTINPLTFFMLSAAYIGMNPSAWKMVISVCKTLSIVFVAMSVITTIIFYTTYGAVYIANSPQIIFLSIGFLPLAVRVLLSEKTSNMLNILLLVVAFFCATFYNSRGWVIQIGLLIICYFFIRNKRYSSIKKAGLIMVGLVVLLVAFTAIMRVIPDRVASLMEKFDTGFDSRAWQYDELLSQYTFSDLLFGKGSFATYNTDVYGTFMYFDNAFVNIAMKYGIFVSALFLIILLQTPLKLLLFQKITAKDKYPAIIILLFFAAIMGLSVYFVVSVDLKFFIISILLGRCEYVYKNSLTLHTH
jgi:hypothetical protein